MEFEIDYRKTIRDALSEKRDEEQKETEKQDTSEEE